MIAFGGKGCSQLSRRMTMDIADAELIWPGSFIAHDDNGSSHQALTLLYLLDGAFAEALLALICFADVMNRDRSENARSEWERDMAERREAEEVAWHSRPDPLSVTDWHAMQREMALKRIEGERASVGAR